MLKKITTAILAICLVIGTLASTVNAAPSGWTTTKPSGSSVSAYGTPSAAIKSGPVYGSGSTLYYQVSPTSNTNNVSFTIPSVNSFFVLNEGWVIDYVYVGGNSSGQRQPGASFLLSSSGGSMVYYFKKVN